MIYYSLSALINALITTALGCFVYMRNKKDLRHITFYVFCVAVASWNYTYFFWQISGTEESALFWSRMLMIGTMFIPNTFLHYTLQILDLDKGWRRKVVFYGYVADFIFLCFIFSPIYVTSVTQKMFFKYWPNPGPLFHFIVLKFIAYSFYSQYLLFKAYRKAVGLKYYQFRILFWAIVVGYIGGMPNWALWYNIPIPPVTHILVSAYMIMLTYGIVQYKILDIEIIVRKTLVFTGLLALILGILILPTLLLQEYLFRNASMIARLIGLTISGIIIIFTMRRTEDFLINITDKYLFQKKYNYKELLKTFTSEVLTVLELDKLVNLTVSKLEDIVKIDSSAVLLLNNETQQFDIVASCNVKDPGVTLIRPDGIVTFLEETHGYLLMSELKEKKIHIPDSIQMIMDELRAELIIPMVVHEKVMGIVSLGKKKSDESYSQDDLDILLPLARTLAIAISNAQLFAELGKTQAEAAQKEKMAVIGTLSAGINHEICNPLGIARGQCEAFLLNIKDGLYKSKTSDELLKKAQEIMAKVIRETDRATAITKKLSSFAKPAKGEAELVDIKKELDEIFGLVNYELKLDKIELEKNITDHLPHILVDRKQFQEVLFNLMRNACQAIGEKGKIIVKAREANDRITIDIQDTGAGIAPDKIKELFNPFFTTKDPGKGTGLGLFIVRQIVEKNGGRIRMKDTKVGEGTTFTIEFPAATRQEVKV